MDHIESEPPAVATAAQSTSTDPPVPPLNQVTQEDFEAMNLEIVNNTAEENDGNTPVKYFLRPQEEYPGEKPELFYEGNRQTTEEVNESVQKTYFGKSGDSNDINTTENAANDTTDQIDSTDVKTKKTRAKKGT